MTGTQEQAEILREKGTDRSKFFRGQVDKYRWVDYGSSYLPSELNAAYLYAQLEEYQRIDNSEIARSVLSPESETSGRGRKDPAALCTEGMYTQCPYVLH